MEDKQLQNILCSVIGCSLTYDAKFPFDFCVYLGKSIRSEPTAQQGTIQAIHALQWLKRRVNTKL